MRFRSNAWAFGATALVLTSAACGGTGSTAPGDDATDVAASATAEAVGESITLTSVRSCNDAPLPAPPETTEPPALTAVQFASLETVQHWADLVSSAEPDQTDRELFAEVHAVFPDWDVDSAERLSAEWGNVEAVHLSWVREDDGTFVIGGLVYDNASTTPCRTGLLCWRADVSGDVIEALTQVNPEGIIDDDTLVTRDYPYIDGRWVPGTEMISNGVTLQSRLIELCGAAVPRANDATPTASGFIEGTAVATSAGGSEACQAQPDGPLPAGLVEGAPVRIRDASSGEVIGTGTVTSTNFVPLTEDTELGLPPWTCTFNIGATLSTPSDAITVQVGELPPWGPVRLDGSGSFNIPVPNGAESTGTVSTSGPDSTLPSGVSTVVPVDSVGSGETSAPGETFVPETTAPA